MAENDLTKAAKILKDHDKQLKQMLSTIVLFSAYTKWYNCTVENGWSADPGNPPQVCHMGDMLAFRGSITSPVSFDGTATKPILQVPITMKTGTKYMQTATNTTLGSAFGGSFTQNSALDIYPKTASELAGWHGAPGSTFNLAGLMFTATN